MVKIHLIIVLPPINSVSSPVLLDFLAISNGRSSLSSSCPSLSLFLDCKAPLSLTVSRAKGHPPTYVV